MVIDSTAKETQQIQPQNRTLHLGDFSSPGRMFGQLGLGLCSGTGAVPTCGPLLPVVPPLSVPVVLSLSSCNIINAKSPKNKFKKKKDGHFHKENDETIRDQSVIAFVKIPGLQLSVLFIIEYATNYSTD